MSTAAHRWGPDSHELLTLDEAWAVIARNVQSLGAEIVPLSGAAGRILAMPVLADDDYPAFDKAMMDGYAVRADDCTADGVQLAVIGRIAAGDAGAVSVGARRTARSPHVNTSSPRRKHACSLA